MQELPALQQSYEAHNGAFEMLGIGTQRQDPDAAAFVEEGGYSWVFGWSDEAPRTYQVSAYPTTFFIDAKGTIMSKVIGGMSHEDFETELSKIL